MLGPHCLLLHFPSSLSLGAMEQQPTSSASDDASVQPRRSESEGGAGEDRMNIHAGCGGYS